MQPNNRDGKPSIFASARALPALLETDPGITRTAKQEPLHPLRKSIGVDVELLPVLQLDVTESGYKQVSSS